MHAAVTRSSGPRSLEFCELFIFERCFGLLSLPMEWQGIIEGLPDHCRSIIVDQGASDPVDVKFLWPSLDVFLRDVKPEDDDELESCRVFHLRCELAGSRELSMRATEVVVRRNSVLSSSSGPQHIVPAPAPKAKQPRLLWRSVAASTPKLPLVTRGAQEPERPVDVLRAKKESLLFNVLRENLLDLSALGLERVRWSDEAEAKAAMGLVMEATRRLSTDRLASLHRAVRRWLQFASEKQVSVMNPAPLYLAAFFQHVARGGPTAASGVYQALRWLVLNLGVSLPIDHVLVRPFRLHAPGHSSKQADELQPWEFLNLLQIAHDLRGAPRLVAALVILSAASCIRFAHLQRSVFVRAEPTFLEFQCLQGKSRRQGTRPPYNWSCPRIRWGQLDVQEDLQEFFTKFLPPGRKFLIPALVLRSEDLWQVQEYTALRLDRRMGRGRFLDLFRGLLVRAGTPFEEAARAGYNRLRRFLPTGASVLGLRPDESQAVGSWVEVPSGTAAKDTPPPKAPRLMSQHYSGEKAATSARIKDRIIRDVFASARRQGLPMQLDAEQLLQPASLTWAHIRPASVTQVPQADSSSSSDESSSTSSASSQGSEGTVPDESLPAEVEWFCQRARRHGSTLRIARYLGVGTLLLLRTPVTEAVA